MVSVRTVKITRDNKIRNNVHLILAKQDRNSSKRANVMTVKTILLFRKTKNNVSLHLVAPDKRFLKMDNAPSVMIMKEFPTIIKNVRK